MGHGQEPARPIQRVVSAAPMSDRLVLDPTAALIQLRVRQADQVERADDLSDMGQPVVESLTIGTGEVQHPEPDALTPFGGTGV